MSIVSEFKQFIQRGNVVDLAVGVIMGAAFGNIVKSLVADIIMPPIGYVIGGVKFTDLKFELPAKAISVPGAPEVALPAASINYGNFLQTTFDFLIIAFCIFLLVKGINALQRKQEAAPPEPTATEKLLGEIRDLLKAKAN
jgi:large conductance mechanosensitive channel